MICSLLCRRRASGLARPPLEGRWLQRVEARDHANDLEPPLAAMLATVRDTKSSFLYLLGVAPPQKTIRVTTTWRHAMGSQSADLSFSRDNTRTRQGWLAKRCPQWHYNPKTVRMSSWFGYIQSFLIIYFIL